jgi:hypothetical protein
MQNVPQCLTEGMSIRVACCRSHIGMAPVESLFRRELQAKGLMNSELTDCGRRTSYRLTPHSLNRAPPSVLFVILY